LLYLNAYKKLTWKSTIKYFAQKSLYFQH